MATHALKARAEEQAGEPPAPGQFWITCGTDSHPAELILLCTISPMGDSPVFIISSYPVMKLDEQFLHPRIERLVDALHSVPSRRVDSIFAPDLITTIFVSLWSKRTGIPFDNELNYPDEPTTFSIEPPVRHSFLCSFCITKLVNAT
jgi:hypothetical protein